MIDSSQIANVAQMFVDKKWALGKPQEGWDCLNSILSFYRMLGYHFEVKEIDGWNEQNYDQKWNEDSDEGRKILGKFLQAIGRPIEKKYYIRGDLLIFGGRQIPDFPGIYLGNGNVFMVFKEGCMVVPFEAFEKHHNYTRRLID